MLERWRVPGMPGVVLTDLSKLSIVVEISESNLEHIQLGKKVDIEIPSINFRTTGTSLFNYS